MKLIYLLLLSGFSLIINLISFYNVGIAYISFFFFVQLFITRIFIRIIRFAEKEERTEESNSLTRFLVAFGNHPIIRTLNRVSIIISLTALGAISIMLVALQFIFKTYMTEFLHATLHIASIDPVMQTLSYLGYAIFAVALFFVMKDSIRILKREPLFQI